MPASLPGPVNVGDFYLAAIHDRLAEQNRLLGDLVDRLGQATQPPTGDAAPAEASGSTPVELREPAPDPAPADPGPEPAALSEPDKPAPRKRATKSTRSAR